jgi:ComF family protein
MPALLRHLSYVLLPATCLLCGAAGQTRKDLCADCQADLSRPPRPCPLCGLPMRSSSDQICARCLRRCPVWDGLVAAFHYASPLDQLVFRLKYQGRLDAARLLGELLAESVTASRLPRPDCLLPVPLHPERLAERGFNQALELARPVARRLGLPLASGHVWRVRATAPQSGLNARMRRQNLRNAFDAGSALRGRRVAIIDDVVTTGSTVAALTRVLRRVGVRRVDVWALARAYGPG